MLTDPPVFEPQVEMLLKLDEEEDAFVEPISSQEVVSFLIEME